MAVGALRAIARYSDDQDMVRTKHSVTVPHNLCGRQLRSPAFSSYHQPLFGEIF